jgi:hypothetical protein
MQRKQLAVAALALGLTGLGPAVGVAADARQIDEASGVRYMSGGIGIDEQQSMEQAASGFDLKLVFANHAGEYLADIPVVIEDRHGTPILRATSEGPWFYAELAPGRYTVVIPEEGARYARAVEVPRHGQKEVVLHLADTVSCAPPTGVTASC